MIMADIAPHSQEVTTRSAAERKRAPSPARVEDGGYVSAEASAAQAFIGRDRRGPFRPKMLVPARSRLSGTMLARMFRTIDLGLVVAVTLAILSRGRFDSVLDRTVAAVGPFAAGGILLGFMLRSTHAYAFGQREPLGRHLLKIVVALAPPAVITFALAHVLAPQMQFIAAVWTTSLLLAMCTIHAFAWVGVRRWRKAGRLTPNIAVVGATQNAARLIEAALASREIAVLGVFDDRLDRAPTAIHGVPVLGDTKQLLQHRILPYVDRIVITVTSAGEARVRELISTLSVLPNAVTLFMDVEGQDTRAATLSRLTDAPLSQLSGLEYDEQRALAKRLQDLVVGGVALIVAAPIMAAVALAVRLGSPGPILFRQNRHGFNNEVITVWKFRSMYAETTDATAQRQVTADDDRITRVGRFIRSTSLDELPQLWNVLKGEMSLVGPRPHAIGMKSGGEESSRLVAEYAWRHRMKPGITGWAQIRGSRGPVDTADQVRRRVALDIEYIERQSLWFDFYILIMTLPCLFGDSKTLR
jgi:Undecaprenyl-phosphate glucose phosphotransferase